MGQPYCAENELKDWFRNDAQNNEDLLDENSVKFQGRDGIIYSGTDIAKMDNFVGVEYVFPEDFDRYSIGNYTYQIEEIDDDK